MAAFALVAHWLACIWYAIANAERPGLTNRIGSLDQLANTTLQPFTDIAKVIKYESVSKKISKKIVRKYHKFYEKLNAPTENFVR